jgi:hypothetical protein
MSSFSSRRPRPCYLTFEIRRHATLTIHVSHLHLPYIHTYIHTYIHSCWLWELRAWHVRQARVRGASAWRVRLARVPGTCARPIPYARIRSNTFQYVEYGRIRSNAFYGRIRSTTFEYALILPLLVAGWALAG